MLKKILKIYGFLLILLFLISFSGCNNHAICVDPPNPIACDDDSICIGQLGANWICDETMLLSGPECSAEHPDITGPICRLSCTTDPECSEALGKAWACQKNLPRFVCVGLD